MATEQEGVSPATAGGASAPDPIGTIRRAGEKLLVLCGGPNGDRRWVDVASGRSIVDGDFWRVDTRPVIGAVPDSPADRDPRDAEIERLRDELNSANLVHGNFVAGILLALDGAPFVGLPELTEQIRQVQADAEQRRVDLHRIREMALVVLNRLPDDEDRPAVDLVREILADWTASNGLPVRYNEVRAERDRLRAELDAAGKELARVQLRVATIETMAGDIGKDLKLVGKPANNSGPVCNAGNEDYPELHCKLAAGHRGDHEDPSQGAIWSPDCATPAEPRRWRKGDPEPEIGVTVTWGAGFATWSRCEDGGWRSDACLCASCLDADGLPWPALLDAAHGELVEVVSTDG